MANLHAVPVANVGQWFAASKGAKEAQAEWFNPYGAELYQQHAKAMIVAEAAQIFLELADQNCIPSWAIAQADLKLIRAAADE